MISVIMPVYNAEKYLGEAIESILCQTDPDFEFIILDDASTDGSSELILHYAARDPRINFVAGRRNRGITSRLNQGLKMASAPLIARMDADDVSEPTRFEKQRAFLAANPGIVLVGSRVLLIDPDGEPLREMGETLTHEEIDRGLMSRNGQLVYHPTIMFRTSAARGIGGYNEQYKAASDPQDFFLRMAEIGRLANMANRFCAIVSTFPRSGIQGLRNRKVYRPRADACQAAARLAGRRQTLRNVKRRTPCPVQAVTYRIWGWWALAGGSVRTARKYALKAFTGNPMDRETLTLLYCAMRGH